MAVLLKHRTARQEIEIVGAPDDSAEFVDGRLMYKQAGCEPGLVYAGGVVFYVSSMESGRIRLTFELGKTDPIVTVQFSTFEDDRFEGTTFSVSTVTDEGLRKYYIQTKTYVEMMIEPPYMNPSLFRHVDFDRVMTGPDIETPYLKLFHHGTSK
jgi:hypothetical protein